MKADEIIAGLETLYTAVICDVLDSLGRRRQSLPHRIRPLTPATKVCGRILTARAEAVDAIPEAPYELEIAAVDRLRAGDVLLIDGQDDATCGLWGELLTTACKVKGVRGAVMTACARDLWNLKDMDFPVFAVGHHPADSKGRVDFVSVGEPIEIGGVAASTGDYLIGDEDGIAVLPAGVAAEAVRLAREKVVGENAARADLERGVSMKEVFRRHGIL